MGNDEMKQLAILAEELRLLALETAHCAGSGHCGGSLSIIDILTVLYFKAMQLKPGEPDWEDRDRLVLSKGHCTPALYAVLAKRGFFPIAELKGFRSIHSFLSGHAEMRGVPGVDMSTGSLGQGLSAAVGMALAGKMDRKNYRVYAIMGDGEIQEGQIWEAAMAAAHYKLDNLIGWLDNNSLQIDGRLEEVMSPYPIGEKFTAFGWEVIAIDGHDLEMVDAAIQKARQVTGRPLLILAKTVKGKGVSFMEDQACWHGKAPNDAEFATAVAEITQRIKQLEAE
jgi:transketolase